MRKYLVAVLTIVFMCSCGCEYQAWRDTVKRGDKDAYYEYIQNYPDGEHVQTAWRMIEKITYRKAMRANTISALQGYLDDFPGGEDVKEVRVQLGVLVKNKLEAMPDERIMKSSVTLRTTKGEFTISPRPDKAPANVRNFLFLALTDFYHMQKVNVVAPDMYIRFGDPTGSGMGGPGYMIEAEINDLAYEKGAVMMWHFPGEPDTAGSQVIILLKDVPDFKGSYTIIGKVTQGVKVVEEISSAPTLGGQKGAEPSPPVIIQEVIVNGIDLENEQ